MRYLPIALVLLGCAASHTRDEDAASTADAARGHVGVIAYSDWLYGGGSTCESLGGASRGGMRP